MKSVAKLKLGREAKIRGEKSGFLKVSWKREKSNPPQTNEKQNIAVILGRSTMDLWPHSPRFYSGITVGRMSSECPTMCLRKTDDSIPIFPLRNLSLVTRPCVQYLLNNKILFFRLPIPNSHLGTNSCFVKISRWNFWKSPFPKEKKMI